MKIINNLQLRGVAYITLSAIFFGSYGVWSRIMGGAFDEFSQGWIRGLILIIIILPIMLWKKQFKSINKPDLKWFIIIALCGGLNQAPYYFAFKYLPIGTATLLFYASLTIGGYIVGKLLLDEQITLQKLFSLMLAIIGMSLIFQFSLSSTLLLPALSAVIAGLMGAAEVALTKKISDHYSTLQILFIIFFVMFGGNFLIALSSGITVAPVTNMIPWVGLVGYTGAMLIALYTVFIGYRYIEASTAGLIGLTEIIFAAVFGFIFYQELLSISTLIGGLCILISISLPYKKGRIL